MTETHEHCAEVPAELAGERIDRVAVHLFAGYSRGQLATWIKAGALTLDGHAVKPKLRVVGGEKVVLAAAIEIHAADRPQYVPFELVYEDEDVLVIDKPAGVVVHPGAGNPDGTLVNGLLNHRPALETLPRAGIVHRLDKDTTGLMVIAGSAPALRALVEAIGARQATRQYLAIVEGTLIAGREIDAPIGRHRHRPTRQQVRDDGKPARTRVRVVQRFSAHTEIEATLETGRTHQIRVHLSHIGHPLVGDKLYGARGRLPPAPAASLSEALRAFPRQALHATRLEFDHPVSGEAMAFQSALPADMTQLLDELQRHEKARGRD